MQALASKGILRADSVVNHSLKTYKDGKIVEEIGRDDGVTALQQLGLIVRAG